MYFPFLFTLFYIARPLDRLFSFSRLVFSAVFLHIFVLTLPLYNIQYSSVSAVYYDTVQILVDIYIAQH